MHKKKYLFLVKFILILSTNLLIGCNNNKNKLVNNQLFEYKETKNKNINLVENQKIKIKNLFIELNDELINVAKNLYQINDLKELKAYIELAQNIKETGFKLLDNEINIYQNLTKGKFKKEINQVKEILKEVNSFYMWKE